VAKIKKETTARVDCVITEIFKDEEAASSGAEAITTEVKVIEIKNDHTNWKKVNDD
jgi:hypothetical protein